MDTKIVMQKLEKQSENRLAREQNSKVLEAIESKILLSELANLSRDEKAQIKAFFESRTGTKLQAKLDMLTSKSMTIMNNFLQSIIASALKKLK